MTTIWIDADAAPRACKEVLYRVVERLPVKLILVANKHLKIPRSNSIEFVLVKAGFDVADEYIADNCVPGDLVITNDIPLAADVIERGGAVIRPRGEQLTANNVRQQLAMRDLLEELRGGGVMTGGPPPYADKDKRRFANTVDRWLTQQFD